MAKEKVEVEEVVDPRQAKWDMFLENYKKQNPEKYEQRMKAGELKMPADFK